MKKLNFKLITLFIFITSTASAQQAMQGNREYFSIYETVSYNGRMIPGLIKEIPVNFMNITNLQAKQLQSEIKKILISIPDAFSPSAITPDTDIAIFKLAILYYENKEYAKAEELFRNICYLGSKQKIWEDSHFYLGIIAMHQKAYQEAKYYFETVLGFNKKRLGAYINLGIIYFYLKDDKKALDNLELALVLDPKNSISRFYKGLVNLKTKNNIEAAGNFSEAQRMRSDDSLFSNWAEPLMEKDKEIKGYKKILKHNPQDINTNVSLGWRYIYFGAAKKAEVCFRQVLKQQPGNIRALMGMVIVNVINKDFSRAEVFARQITRYSPNKKSVEYYFLGWIQYHAQNFQGSKEFLLKSIEANDGDKEFLALAHSLLGEAYLEQGKLKEAEDQLKKCKNIGITHSQIDELEAFLGRFKRIHLN